MSGASDLVNRLLPPLLQSYATGVGVPLETASNGYKATLSDGEVAQITATASTSSKGLRDLLEGRSSVALSVRPMRTEERAAFAAGGVSDIREDILAIEAMVIVTGPGSSLPSISVADAALIFSGGVTNWSELGGPDAPINLYVREPGAGLSEVFEDLVLGPNRQTLSPNARVVNSDDDVSRLVAQDPAGIGYVRFSRIGDTRALPIRGVCGLVVTPNEFNIKAEEYPLSYRKYAVTVRDRNSDFLNGMLDYIGRDSTQDMLVDSGMLSQSLSRGQVDQQGMRFASALQSESVIDAIPLLQQMANEMIVSERLSATMRFETGSSELDGRALADIARVAKLLAEETADASRKVVRVMGFTDSLGNPELNRELSIRRARQVTEALLQQDPSLAERVDFRPMGFGEVSPIGCDQTAKGRWTNRRVELWVSNAAG